MHCNLRPPEPRQPFPAFIATPCQVWSRWTYPLPYYSFFCCWYITLRRSLWPLTFDIEQLQHIKLTTVTWWNCTKFERNRAIPGKVIAISLFDLMTLNISLRVMLSSGIFFTRFDLGQLIRAWIIIALFDADTLCHAVTLTFDPLTSKVCAHIKCHMVKVCTKFEWNRAIPGWIMDNFCTYYFTL